MRVASREVKPSHFMALSFASSLFAGLAKLVMAFLTQSLLVGFNALYSLVLCIPRFSSARATRNRERAHALRRHSGERMPARSSKRTRASAGVRDEAEESRSQALTAVFIVFLGLVFLGMSNHTFVNGEGLRMSTIPAITFATCAFTKIGTAIYGVVKERGNTSSVVFANKLTSLADGMASIVLTQMALRSSQGQQSDIFDAVFGMAVGFVIVLMGIWLFKRTQAPSR